VKIDGLMLGWSSGVRLHVDEHSLVIDSDVGRVTLHRDQVERIEPVRGFSSRGVRIATRGSGHFIWEFQPGEVAATFVSAGWPVAETRARFVGLRRAWSGGLTFVTDRAVVTDRGLIAS